MDAGVLFTLLGDDAAILSNSERTVDCTDGTDDVEEDLEGCP